jgi:hypothetical protein
MPQDEATFIWFLIISSCQLQLNNKMNAQQLP